MSKFAPSGWTLKELGDVTDKIEGGGTPSRTEPAYWNGNIPWVTVKDLKKVRLSFAEESISALGLKESASRLIPKNTLIIATRMALGKAVMFDRAVTINQDLKAVFPKSDLDPEYLLHWYLSKAESIQSMGTGSTVKGIRLEDLRLIPIALPPLPEQQKIASILTAIDEVIESTQAQINKLKDLKTGMMHELLTKGIGQDGKPHTEFKDSPLGRIPKAWDRKPLHELCMLITKGATPTTSGHAYAECGIRFYRSVNATNDGTLDREDVKYVTIEADSSQKRSRLALGDIAISIVGAQTGRTYFCITNENELPANINQNIALIRPSKQTLSPEFLKYVIASTDFQFQVDMEITTQAQPCLSLAQVGSFLINLPSLAEQSEISRHLNSISRLIDQNIGKLKILQNSKKALMQDLLTGTVRVSI